MGKTTNIRSKRTIDVRTIVKAMNPDIKDEMLIKLIDVFLPYLWEDLAKEINFELKFNKTRRTI